MSEQREAPGPADWYAPNQQAVRGDSSGPAEEGDGGSPPVEGISGDTKDEPEPQPEPEPEPAPAKEPQTK